MEVPNFYLVKLLITWELQCIIIIQYYTRKSIMYTQGFVVGNLGFSPSPPPPNHTPKIGPISFLQSLPLFT